MRELLRFLRRHWIELLVAGVWLQSVISAAFTGNLLIFAITTFGGLVLLIGILSLVGCLSRRRPPAYGDSAAFAVPRKAIVFTVGGQQSTLFLALRVQRPAWLGLLCSAATKDIADEVFEQSGLDAEHCKQVLADPWNVADVRLQTTALLDWLARNQVASADIAVDITGGTTIMSAGAFSVAAENRIDCQYVRSEYDAANKPISNTQRGVFVTRYEARGRPAGRRVANKRAGSGKQS